MLSISDLHDATLKTLEVDWAKGELVYNFSVYIKSQKKSGRILATGLKFLKCPRQYPWGRSTSINGLTEQKIETGVLLAMEMQSGDLIEANIDRYAIEILGE